MNIEKTENNLIVDSPEDSMKQSETDYRAMFSRAHDAIIIFAPEGEIILDVNNRACEIYGFSRSEFLGMSMEKLGKNPARGKEKVRQMLENEEHLSFETVQYRKDGSEIFLEINASKIIYRGETAIISINRDITERRQIEAALRKSEERYRQIIETAGDIIYRTDCEGRFTFVNPFAARLLNYSENELLGMHFTNLVRPDMRQTAARFYDSIFRQKQPDSYYEFPIVTKDGTEIWIGQNVQPVIENERILGFQAVARDITAHKSVEANLRKSEERFQLATRATNDVVWDWDLTTDELLWNQNFQKMFGYSAEETGTHINSWATRLHPDDLKRVEESVYKAIENREQSWSGEYRFRRRDASYAFVADRGYIVYDDNGKPVRMIGSVMDITERRLTEESLRESELKFRSVTESANDAIIAADSKGKIISWNNGAERIFGYTDKEALNKPLTVLMPEVYREAHRLGMKRYNETGEAHVIGKTIELFGLRKDFSEFPLELSLTSWMSGEDRFYSGIIRDITERKLAEAALEAAARREKSIIDNALDVICTIDVEGRFVTVNPACFRMWGYQPEELIGRLFIDYVAPEDVAKTIAQDASIVAGSETTTFENRYLHKNGTLVHVRWAAYWSESEKLVFCVAHDITALKQIEEQQERHAQHEALRADIGAVLVGRHSSLHELLQPCAEAITNHLGAAFARIWTLNEKEQMLEMQASAGMYTHLDGAHGSVPVGQFKIGLIAEERRAHLTNDVCNDPRVGDRAWAEKEGLVSFAGYPLITEDRLVGVMALFSRKPILPVTDKMLAPLAAIIALGIESRRAEELLLHQRNFTSAITNNIGEGVYALDCEGRVTFMNAAAENILGWKEAELLGKKIHEAIHYQRADGMRVEAEDCPLLKVLQSGERVYLDDDAFTHKNGKIISVSCTSVPIITNGQIVGGVYSFHNISEQKRNARKLSMLASIVESSVDAILSQTLEGEIISWNAGAEKLYGYSANEIIGQSVSVLYSPVLLGEEPQIIASILRGERVQNYETTRVSKDGTNISISLTASPLMDATGKIIGISKIAHDITARKRIEEELKNRQAQLDEAQEIAHLGSWEWDVKTNNVAWSNEGFRIFGLKPQEFGMTFEAYVERVHPDDREMVVKLIQNALQEREYPSFEHRILRPDGSERTIYADGKIILDEKGEPVKMLGIILDITERKRIEQALAAAAERERAVIDNALDVICTVDAEGRFVTINPACYKIWGYQPEELIGRPYIDLVAPEDVPKTNEIAAKIVSGEQTTDFENRYRHKNGTFVNTMWTSYWSESEQLMFAVAHDITERMRAEADLQESETRYRLLFETNPTPIWVYDIETFKFLAVNEEATRHYGYSREEFQNLTIKDVRPPGESADFYARVAQVKAGIEKFSSVKHQKKDGTIIEVEVNVQPINFAGRQARLALITDITERRRIEEELEQTRDAALESARLKSEFLANMSHEIRTPMNGVIGMTELLLGSELSAQQQEHTRTIQASAEALLTIIDDILDFSKIEAGQLRFEKIDFDLRATVESTVELLAERAHSKELEIAALVYQNVPTQLCGDPGRLRQILTNLIGNAIKFTGSGEVTVNVQNQSETDADVSLRFEVTDTGIGISKDAQEQLFQAFVQADGSTTRKYGGTGLGLAISKQLVEMMGGEIGIISQPGKGSTFWFTACFEKKPPSVLTARPAADVSLEGVRLLIVDDNATNRKILLHQTSSWKMIGTEAHSGERALAELRAASARREPFEVAILDLMMPEMDGFALAQAIKADPDISAARLILLPSSAKRGHGLTASEIGIAAYLQKPVRQSQLYGCLVSVMSQETVSQSNEQPRQLITKHTLHSPSSARNKLTTAAKKTRILVAEDNVINREVAIAQLESLGYSPDVVFDGREAVEKIKKSAYDIVLMDCQMPEMDGFEATAEMRRYEGEDRHTVIIAMTANALDGDREKCLAAGMDDYLSKPVKIETLRQKLEQWAVSAIEENEAPNETAPDVSLNDLRKRIVDLSVIESYRELQQTGQPDLVDKLINLFVEDITKRLTKLKQATADGDAETIKGEAHNVKGAAGNIGALRMVGICRELEQNESRFNEADVLISRLESEFKQAVEILNSARQPQKD